FVEVLEGKRRPEPLAAAPAPATAAAPPQEPPPSEPADHGSTVHGSTDQPEAAPAADDILPWLEGRLNDQAYVRQHLTRLSRTLELAPSGDPEGAALEMGAYLHITPALRYRLGYGEVRG